MGLNAVDWQAYAEGINPKQLQANAQNETTKAQEKQQNSLTHYQELQRALKETQEQLEDEEANLITDNDITAVQEKAAQEVAEEKTSALSKQITINKAAGGSNAASSDTAVSSGGCGGGSAATTSASDTSYTSDGAITLTVEELNALSDVLADTSKETNLTDNTKSIAAHLNSTMTSGATATAGTDEDGTKFVEIKRANGSSVKICDANGNGALDTKDYDFSSAINQAKSAIEQMNLNVENITRVADSNIETMTQQKEEQEQNIKTMQEQIQNLEMSEIPDAEQELAQCNEDVENKNANYEQLTIEANKPEGVQNKQNNIKPKLGS